VSITIMAGKKGKKDPEKKAALQAKKEAKADKSVLKRLKKEAQQSYEGRVQAQQEGNAEAIAPPTASDDLDDWLRHYRRLDEVDKVVVEDIDGFPPPRANATLTLYEESSSKKGKQKKEFYLFGGEYFDGVSSVVVNHLLKLTIDSSSSAETKCRWKHIHAPKAPPPRCAHSTVYYNHALYVFGGEISAGDAYHHYRDCWKFDLAKMEWTEIVGNKAAAPSPRSGHVAVVWKHYMVVFGGFFESSRSTAGGTGKDASAAKWFHDVHVLDLQTQVWLDSVLSHSKLAQRPDRRSACNACVVNDDLIVHGGFSKLERKSVVVTPGAPSSSVLESGGGRSYMSSSGVVVVPSTAAETKVHTDAWKLPLTPLVDQGKLAWERVTWSSSRTSNPTAATAGPSGRSGCGSVGYKDRLLVFGGVVDAEQMHHKVDSVFYNDLNVLDVGKRKWYPIWLSSSATRPAATASPSARPTEAREKAKESVAQEGETNSDSDLSDMEDGGDDAGQLSTELFVQPEGWDLTKLRSNMFAFLDGEGNLVYENLEEEKKTAVDDDDDDDDDDDEVEESKDGDGEDTELNPKPSKMIDNSAVLKVNPQTKVPEPLVRSDPLPRINARLVMVGHVLYVYGGLVEVGDREVTLDDLWRFDLKKRDQWECLFPGTMHLQKWRGALQDDDDSYVSGGTGHDQQEDGDDDSDNEEQEEEKDEGVERGAAHGGHEDDGIAVPLEGESLTDYYKRTASHWMNEASILGSATGAGWSDKELKREAFRLAQERMLGIGRIQDQVRALD
jgi:Domain of unknown function (DUF4110)/Galactose oxidase, central domain/Kelch motif